MQYFNAVELAKHSPGAGAEVLSDLARKFPSDSRVLHAYGATLHRVGRHNEARTALEAAASREKVYITEVQGVLSQVYLALGMNAHALRAARRSGRVVPEEAEAGIDRPEGAKTADLLAFEAARTEIMYGDAAAGVAQMEAFLKRFPDYVPARNNLSTGLYLLGDLPGAQAVAEAVLAAHPRNIHALVNLIRLSLILHGLDAARAFAPRLEQIAGQPEEGVVDRELALANAYALLEDDAGVRRGLDAWQTEHPGEALSDNTAGDMLEGRWALRHPTGAGSLPFGQQDTGTPPYFTAEQLLPPAVIRSWVAARGASPQQQVFASLAAMPGLLTLLPERLGFSEVPFANVVAVTLLEAAGPRTEAFTEMLRNVVQHGPGRNNVRLALGGLLQDRDLLPPEVLTDLAGAEGGRLLQLEIHDDVEPSNLSSAGQKVLERGLNLMRSGEMAQATALLTPLVAANPDSPTAAYNLAVAEKHSGDSDLVARSRERFEDLAGRFETYLFPRAELAVQAIERGDLERARDLLAIPRGLRRIHYQEYSFFMSAQGRLKLAEGDEGAAREMLAAIEDIDGQGSPAYLLLERAFPRARRPKRQRLLRRRS